MKWPFRPRPGVGDDVVYEIKSFFFLWCPNWSIGYKEYANAASARNRISTRLNEMAEKFEKELHKYAEAEAELKAERDDLKGSRYNHLGIGEVIYLEKKDFKEMLPYIPEPKPKWKEFVQKAKVIRILREHGALDKTKQLADARVKGTTIYSPSDAVDDHPEFFASDSAEHLVKWRPEKKNSGANGQNKQGGRATIKNLRDEFPQEDDEDYPEWDKRLKAIAQERNNS